MSIYNTDVDTELERTKRILNNESNYQAIKKFSRDMKLIDGLSEARILIYIQKIRPLANFLQDKFLDPDEEDLKNAIDHWQQKGSSIATIEMYKQTMKRFYKWKLNDKKYNEACGWIKVRTGVERHKKAEDMLTYEEVSEIIRNCNSLRDKAFVSLLYDSGARIGEVLNLRIRDIALDDNGMIIHVSGKTGERKEYVIGDSISYLKRYLETHPFNDNPDSYLFLSAFNGQFMYDQARMILNRAVKKAGINKRVHPHLFRHSWASRYAEILPDAILKEELGWSPRSAMIQNYIHLSGVQIQNALLKANGKPAIEKTIEKHDIRKCQRCGEINESTAKYCHRCWFPLTLESSVQLLDKQKNIENLLESKGIISPEIQAIINSMPDDKKESILNAVIEAALKNKK